MEHIKAPTLTQKIVLEVNVTPEMILQLRRELGQSLTEFGLTLKRAIDPGAIKPYSRQYISRLEHGRDAITPELASAFYNIATGMDEVPAGMGGAVMVSVLAQPGQGIEGAFIPRGAKVLHCANPECNVLFVQVHPQQKYHDIDCKVKH